MKDVNIPKNLESDFQVLTSLKEIKNRDTVLQIKCKKCNQVFEKTYFNFIRSKNCPLCDPKKAHRKKTKEEFIQDAISVHGTKYDYSLVDYKNNKTKIKIICPIHGEFFQTPKMHIAGHGCSACSGGIKDTKESFIAKAKRIHGDNAYDYSLVDYKNSKSKIKIKCNECGETFEIAPNSFLQGRGCSHGRKSFGEKIIKQFLTEHNIKFIREATIGNLVGKKGGLLRMDFFLPQQNVVIEFQGLQHFQPREQWGGENYLKILQEHDAIKRNYCKKNNIKEIEIPYNKIKKIGVILEQNLLT